MDSSFNAMRVISFILILFSFYTLSQDGYIVLTKKDKDREVKIKEGSRIKVQLKNQKYHTGKFQIRDDSTLIIKETVVEIDQINKIKVIEDARLIFGGMFIAASVGVVSAGVYTVTSANNIWTVFAGAAIIAMSPIPLGIGLAILVLNVDYDIEDHWDLCIE